MPRWPEEKIAFAQDLRAKGHSLSEIHWKLRGLFGLTSYSRTWYYVKDTPIAPEHQALWKERVLGGGSTYRARLLTQAGVEKASALLTVDNPLTLREYFLIAAMLYWGEGTKRDLSVVNTDPRLLRVFIDALVHTLRIPRERFRFSLRIFEDLDRETCIQFWCEALDLTHKQLTAVSVLNGKKQGRLLYGMCRIRLLRGMRQLRLLNAIAQKVFENIHAPIVQ